MSLTPHLSHITNSVSPSKASGTDRNLPQRNQSAPAFGVRTVDIAAIRNDGSLVIGQRRIPTTKVFDEAFAGFAQGTLFQTETGQIAVEDLQPGQKLLTARGKSEEITWIGSATFAPSDKGDRMRLTRIMADSFGVNRPDSFISLGSSARILKTPPDLRCVEGNKQVMTPAHTFVDGVNVIEIMPPTPVRLFHISMRAHTSIFAGGLEVESYHPGHQPLQGLSQTLCDVFMSMFPHIENLSDFGAMQFPRAPEKNDLTAA